MRRIHQQEITTSYKLSEVITTYSKIPFYISIQFNFRTDDAVICSHLTGGIVGVLGEFGVHAVQADRVGDFANSETSFVQNGDDAFVWLLHKIHNDLVVEVINLCANSMIV